MAPLFVFDAEVGALPKFDDSPVFQVRVDVAGDAIVLNLEGELDLAARDAATTAFEQAIDSAPRAVLVNLQGLRFMDSTGLLCLLAAKSRADEAGIRIAVLNGSGPPHRVLTLGGLDTVIEMFDDESQFHRSVDQPLEIEPRSGGE